MDVIHAGRPRLSVHLNARHGRYGASKDLDEAIVLSREALDLYPSGHPDRPISLNNLANRLSNRYNRYGATQDLDEAIAPGQEALDLRPPGHPRRSISLNNVALFLVARYNRGWSNSRAILLGQEALDLRPPGHPGHPLLNNLATRFSTRYDQNEATQRLSSLIRNVPNSPGTDQREQVYHLNVKLQKVVINICELPGFSHSLLASLFSGLRHTASGGPVVAVNTGKHSCDALVIFLDRDPGHIPLPVTRPGVRGLSESKELLTLTMCAKRADVTRELAAFLRKLWDQIVSPIVDFLQTTLPFHSRIWWCPTAECRYVRPHHIDF